MIKIISIIGLIVFSTCCYADQTPVQLQKFVPKSWEIISQTNGDLNADGSVDTAMIIQPKNMNIHNRKLLILFNNKNALQLKYSKRIPDWTYHDNKEDCLEDTLDESSLSIKQHILDLTFNEQPNCANTFGNIYTYRFKMMNGNFQLIGFESLYLDKLTGKQLEESLNFLNKKAKITTTANIFSEVQKAPQIKWISIKSTPFLTLEDMPFQNEDINYTFADRFIK